MDIRDQGKGQCLCEVGGHGLLNFIRQWRTGGSEAAKTSSTEKASVALAID